jgi:hypothetical protein
MNANGYLILRIEQTRGYVADWPISAAPIIRLRVRFQGSSRPLGAADMVAKLFAIFWRAKSHKRILCN